MNSDVSKLMAMVCGQNRNDFDMNSIPLEIRNQIDNALESVFIGKSTLLWLNGGKLIDAWNIALNDLRDTMFAIPNTSPVVIYLRMAVFNHRAKWNAKMMHSDERNTVACINTDVEKQEVIDNANAMITVGMKTIQDIINTPVGTQHTQGQTKRMEQSMTYQNEHSHGRERNR
ncbi:MAG: hypothetical protein J5613_04625 [Alphaproteobacteria bacterium]|nr:hypothetical protein [Alphaproteobacteria bacterium]